MKTDLHGCLVSILPLVSAANLRGILTLLWVLDERSLPIWNFLPQHSANKMACRCRGTFRGEERHPDVTRTCPIVCVHYCVNV
jgi:hypothetical protein